MNDPNISVGRPPTTRTQDHLITKIMGTVQTSKLVQGYVEETAMERAIGMGYRVEDDDPSKRPPDFHGYFTVAERLIVGMRVLLPAWPETGPRTAPTVGHAFFFLCAHAVECLLKAYLTRDNSKDSLEKVRKHDIRHNLAALWEMAHHDGLGNLAQVPEWIEGLGDVHDSPYALRYMTGLHGAILFTPTTVMPLIDGLLDQVRSMLPPAPRAV